MHQDLSTFLPQKSLNLGTKKKKLVGLSNKIGTEIDLGIKYVIDKYIYFRFSQGYLFADEGIGIKNPDNAWKTEANVTVRF